ncbi:MAG: hypothetical protein OHK0052_14200 [Anaerolineales bacterium]
MLPISPPVPLPFEGVVVEGVVAGWQAASAKLAINNTANNEYSFLDISFSPLKEVKIGMENPRQNQQSQAKRGRILRECLRLVKGITFLGNGFL